MELFSNWILKKSFFSKFCKSSSFFVAVCPCTISQVHWNSASRTCVTSQLPSSLLALSRQRFIPFHSGDFHLEPLSCYTPHLNSPAQPVPAVSPFSFFYWLFSQQYDPGFYSCAISELGPAKQRVRTIVVFLVSFLGACGLFFFTVQFKTPALQIRRFI